MTTKNRQEIKLLISSAYPDNNTKKITPETHRGFLSELVDSVAFKDDIPSEGFIPARLIEAPTYTEILGAESSYRPSIRLTDWEIRVKAENTIFEGSYGELMRISPDSGDCIYFGKGSIYETVWTRYGGGLKYKNSEVATKADLPQYLSERIKTTPTETRILGAPPYSSYQEDNPQIRINKAYSYYNQNREELRLQATTNGHITLGDGYGDYLRVGYWDNSPQYATVGFFNRYGDCTAWHNYYDGEFNFLIPDSSSSYSPEYRLLSISPEYHRIIFGSNTQYSEVRFGSRVTSRFKDKFGGDIAMFDAANEAIKLDTTKIDIKGEIINIGRDGYPPVLTIGEGAPYYNHNVTFKRHNGDVVFTFDPSYDNLDFYSRAHFYKELSGYGYALGIYGNLLSNKTTFYGECAFGDQYSGGVKITAPNKIGSETITSFIGMMANGTVRQLTVADLKTILGIS